MGPRPRYMAVQAEARPAAPNGHRRLAGRDVGSTGTGTISLLPARRVRGGSTRETKGPLWLGMLAVLAGILAISAALWALTVVVAWVLYRLAAG